MPTNHAHHMAPATPGVATVGCPVCGGPVPDRTGRPGRRAAWCSKACRQAAWRARRNAAQAAAAARDVADRIPGARRDLDDTGTALRAALDRMADAADAARVLRRMTARDTTGTGADDAAPPPLSGWERDVADTARRLAAAAMRVAELADAHATHAEDHRRARAVVRRPPAPRGRRDDSPETPGGIVATTAAKASETNHAATVDAAAVVVDVDELFDAIEDVLDVRDVPGAVPQDVPQDVLQDVPGVFGTSYASALDALAAAHANASGDGPVDALVAAAAEVVRARPPYLPARAEAALNRLREVVTSP
jgi:hypothetical protein